MRPSQMFTLSAAALALLACVSCASRDRVAPDGGGLWSDVANVKAYQQGMHKLDAELRAGLRPSSTSAVTASRDAEQRNDKHCRAMLRRYESLATQLSQHPATDNAARMLRIQLNARLRIVRAMLRPNDYVGSPTQFTPYDWEYRRVSRFLKAQHYPKSIHNHHAQGVLGCAAALLRQAYALPYRSEAGPEFWQTPAETQACAFGDCEDKAIWLYHRLREQGISDVRIFVGRWRQNEGVGHAWVVLYDQLKTYVLDPTHSQHVLPSDQLPKANYVPHYSYSVAQRWSHLPGYRGALPQTAGPKPIQTAYQHQARADRGTR